MLSSGAQLAPGDRAQARRRRRQAASRPHQSYASGGLASGRRWGWASSHGTEGGATTLGHGRSSRATGRAARQRRATAGALVLAARSARRRLCADELPWCGWFARAAAALLELLCGQQPPPPQRRRAPGTRDLEARDRNDRAVHNAVAVVSFALESGVDVVSTCFLLFPR